MLTSYSLLADVVAVKYGRAEFTWGAGKDLVAKGDARTRYLVALRTLDANENDVKSPLEFARFVTAAATVFRFNDNRTIAYPQSVRSFTNVRVSRVLSESDDSLHRCT